MNTQLIDDVKNLIISYLDPEISTILSKNQRKWYFSENIISVENILYPDEVVMADNLVSEFNFIRLRIKNGTLIRSTKADNNIIAIEKAYVYGLYKFLSRFPNLRKISGNIEASTSNLELLKNLDNDLIIILRREVDIPNYKSISPKNLVSISKEIPSSARNLLIGMENLIYKIPRKFIEKNTLYSNLRIITGDIRTDFASGTYNLPKFEICEIDYYTPESDYQTLLHNYQNIRLVETWVSSQSLMTYQRYRDLPVFYLIYGYTDLKNVVKLEDETRENYGTTVTKTLLISRYLYILAQKNGIDLTNFEIEIDE